MTWSLTLAGLPGAGANSKPNHYKQKVQKKAIPKTRVLTGKQFEVLKRKKEQKHYFDLSKAPVGHQDLGAIN